MAARFWIGGTGNWDAADTTHWSDTSGGAGGFSVPGSGDTVTLDGSSGGGTVTMTAGVTVTSITMGAFTGTLDTNGQTVTVSGLWDGGGVGTRTVTLGASVITVGSWDFFPSTNLTFNANTSVITMNGISAVFFSGGLTYHEVIMTWSANQTLYGAATYTNLKRIPSSTGSSSLYIFGTQTVTGTFTVTGYDSANNRTLIASYTKGTAFTITAAAVSASNADFQDTTGAGAGSWDLSAITGGSGDCGGNSGITFTTGATQYWYTATTGAKTWSTAGNWYLGSGGTGGAGRVPLPQDTARFDSASIGAASTTITQDMPRIPATDWTGVTNTPTWTTSTAASFFGSITLVSGMTLTSSLATYTYEGRGSSTLTSAGKSWGQKIFTIDCVGGTLTLGDAFLSTQLWTFSSGTFNDGGYNFTFSSLSHGNGTKTITGSGIWSLTGTSGNVWQAAATWTVSGTITVRFTGALVSNLSMLPGTGTTYYLIEFATTGAFENRFTGAITATNGIYVDASAAARTLLFTAGTTNTVGNMTRDAGTNVITLGSITAANHNLVKSGGGVINGLHHMNISRSQATPSTNTWYANIDSVDSGNNSGWIFGVIPPGYTTTATAAAFSFVSKAASALSDFTSRASAASFSFVSNPGTTSGTITSVATAASFLFNAASATAKGIATVAAAAASFVYSAMAGVTSVVNPDPRVINVTVSVSPNPAIVVSRSSYSITVSR